MSVAIGFFSMFSELRRRDRVDQDRAALDEARTWLSRLTATEFRGPNDTIGAARSRIATEINIRPSYLERLWKRGEAMSGVTGGAYRALRSAYEERCGADRTPSTRTPKD